jgi:VWFA-related protein
MKRILSKGTLVVALAGTMTLLFAQERQQDRQIEEERTRPEGQAAIRLEVEQIRVDVTVRDRNGNLITGLTQDNFAVYEDNVRQEITFFEPVEAPMTAVLITEYSRVIPWELLYEAIMASYTFVDQMRQDDWIAVIAYDIRPEILVDFTQNRVEVHQSLQRLNFPAYRESNLYDTLYDTLDRIEELDQKTAIVLLSSGLDTFSKKNLGEMLDRVKRTNAVIYPVSLGGNLRARGEHRMGATTRMDLYQGDAALRAFAKSTGGEAFFPRFITQYPGIFGSIAALLRNQYSLGYVTSNPTRDGKFRKIRVDVTADVSGDGKPDRLKVHHREGYVARKAD